MHSVAKRFIVVGQIVFEDAEQVVGQAEGRGGFR